MGDQTESNVSMMGSSHIINSNNRFGDFDEAWNADPFYQMVWEATLKLDKKDKKSPPQNKVTLVNFCSAYLDILQKPYDRIDEMCLATVLNDLEGDGGVANSAEPIDNACVSRTTFYKLQVFYGAPPQNIAKIRDVLERGKTWFHGNKSKEVAQRQLLEQNQDNLYLVRYSTTKGAFTIDYKKRGKICRFNNIENLPGGRIEVTIGRPGSGNEKQYTYSLLSSFILKNSHVFGEPYVDFNSRFQWLKIRLSTPDSFSTLHDFFKVSPSTILSTSSSSAAPSSQQRKLKHQPDNENRGGSPLQSSKGKEKSSQPSSGSNYSKHYSHTIFDSANMLEARSGKDGETTTTTTSQSGSNKKSSKKITESNTEIDAGAVVRRKRNCFTFLFGGSRRQQPASEPSPRPTDS
eukprot:TRINITY_DN828_c2_g1_i1.p1 TRINITY_DN828_c2_g1~~TRINITY_DN828_c2_g1_i1.p1  ORF type:complete len:428 (+),score=109.93 TRINITY_DN828_c2_g1_i1:72-1286(+)